jgi:hypothetical protein
MIAWPREPSNVHKAHRRKPLGVRQRVETVRREAEENWGGEKAL